MAASNSWDSYFQQCGLDPAKLKEQRIVELKCGDKQIQFPFSMEQFLMQYIPQNNNAFNVDKLVDDILYSKTVSTYEAKLPPSRQVMFLEGQPVSKTKKGTFSKKPIQHPSRLFLLFKDEYLKEIPTPVTKLSRQAENSWPFIYVPVVERMIAAGKLYSTGKRIILDAYYTDSDGEFATMQLWGKIDFQNCAKIFNQPHFMLRKYIKSKDLKQHSKWEPFSALGLENDIQFGYVQDAVRILDIKTIGISGTEKVYTEINSMLKGTDGSKGLQTTAKIYGVSEQLCKELAGLQPINLEDIMAMWQYASSNKFFEIQLSGINAEKKSVSLVA